MQGNAYLSTRAKQNSVCMPLIIGPSETIFYDMFCDNLNSYKPKAL